MKKATKAVLIGAGVIGGLLLADKAVSALQGGSGGSLGGNDQPYDSTVTDPSNPFSRIDPNNRDSYFIIDPNTGGVVGPDGGNGNSGNGGVNDPNAGDTTIPNEPGATYPTESSPSLWSNPLVQGAAFAGGYLAVEGAVRGTKALFRNKAATGEARAKATEEAVKLERSNPIERVREKLGFKSSEARPAEELLRGTQTVPEDFAATKTEVRGSGKVVSENPRGKVSEAAGKAGEVATKALIVGHVVNRGFGAWNEYGQQFLEPRTGFEQTLFGSGPSAVSTAKATAVTATAATSDILGDLFAFTTGLVYRPKTSDERRSDQLTGFFASEREILEGLKDPGSFLRGLVGYDQVQEAVGASSAASQVPTSQQTSTQVSALVSGSDRTKLYAENLLAGKEGRYSTNLSTGVTTVKGGGKTTIILPGPVQSNPQTVAQVNALKSQGLNNAQIINAVVSGSSGGSSKSSSKSSTPTPTRTSSGKVTYGSNANYFKAHPKQKPKKY